MFTSLVCYEGKIRRFEHDFEVRERSSHCFIFYMSTHTSAHAYFALGRVVVERLCWVAFVDNELNEDSVKVRRGRTKF